MKKNKGNNSDKDNEMRKMQILGFTDNPECLTLAVKFEDDPKYYSVSAESLKTHYMNEVIEFLENNIY